VTDRILGSALPSRESPRNQKIRRFRKKSLDNPYHTVVYRWYFASKGGDEMEMDMQDPGDMRVDIEMSVPLLSDGGWRGKMDFR